MDYPYREHVQVLELHQNIFSYRKHHKIQSSGPSTDESVAQNVVIAYRVREILVYGDPSIHVAIDSSTRRKVRYVQYAELFGNNHDVRGTEIFRVVQVACRRPVGRWRRLERISDREADNRPPKRLLGLDEVQGQPLR